MLRLHDAAYNSMAKLPKIHGGDAACRKPVQSLPSPRSAALFAARLRRARSETPGWRILCSSPASFAGRLDLISDGKGNSAVRLEAGLDFGTDVHPGLHHRAILNRAAKGAALVSDDDLWQELIWTGLQHAVSRRWGQECRDCHVHRSSMVKTQHAASLPNPASKLAGTQIDSR